MGGDNAPEAIVEGAVEAVREIEDDIVIIGNEELIRKTINEFGYHGNRITVVNATEVISNDESPVRAVRRKKDSSIVVGMNMLKEGKGDVLAEVSASASKYDMDMAGGLFLLGRIEGIDRPAIGAVYPVMGSEPSLLVDTGANTECKPKNLLDFGIMGSIYLERVLNRRNPRVGLVNNGTEAHKGTMLTKEA